MKNLLFLLVASVLIVISCSKDENNPFPNAEEELHYYFENFINEAAERGITIDLSDIDGRISPISTPGLIGLCQFNEERNNQISIDQNSWDEGDTLFREYVVFHELGHCKLFREHLDATDPDGFCFSLMASGTASCNTNYTLDTRENYIDELFGN